MRSRSVGDPFTLGGSARFSLILLVIPILASCLSPAERAARQAQEEQRRQAAIRANLQADQAKCGNFGFKSGTDAFAQCVMEQSKAREAAAKENARAAATRSMCERQADAYTSTKDYGVGFGAGFSRGMATQSFVTDCMRASGF